MERFCIWFVSGLRREFILILILYTAYGQVDANGKGRITMRKWLSLSLFILVVLATCLVLLERKASHGQPTPQTTHIDIEHVLDR